MYRRFFVTVLAGLSTLAAAAPAPLVDPTPFCDNDGVWIQILGAGGPELNDGQAGPSYLVFVDNRARLLVDAGSGSAANFDRAGGRIEDLDAIVFTHLHVDHSVDFPSYVKGSYFAERDRPLPVLGPDGSDLFPGTVAFVERLIGTQGAYPYLADFLTFRSSGGYKISPQDVPASGRREWADFNGERLRLVATPVHHGPVPALAWKAQIGDYTIVFTGDFNNQKDVIADFAAGADALVIHHAVPDGVRGTAADLHVTPTQIGRIAARAGPRMVILGHRMSRTRGIESSSRDAIREHYSGSLIFANDMECWGL